jgi:hypothetical protein
MACTNCAHEDQPDMAPAAPMPDSPGGPAGPTPGMRTRDFPNTWDTSPSVVGPMGRINTGYSHNVVSTEGQWARGDLPPLGYGYTFALRRPHLMREPRTDLGTYNFAKG